MSLAKSAPMGMGLVGIPGGTVTLELTLGAICPPCPTTSCPAPATPTAASVSVDFYPGSAGACPPGPPVGAPTFSHASPVALPACTAAGAFTTYTVVVPVPAATPFGFYCARGTVSVIFSDGLTLAASGDTIVGIVPPVPGQPGVPRLSLTLLSESAPRMAPGDGTIARYVVRNNDPSNSVQLMAFATSRQSAVRPQGANERQGVFAISNPFGDDFPILFNPGANCIPLPAHPYTQQELSNSVPLLPPGGSNMITVGIRSYGQCANGSCSESTLRVTGTFLDGSPAMACAGMALIVDASRPSSACASAVNDCNHNGIPDALDIEAGRSQDRNYNAMPDECEQFISVPTSTSISPTNPAPAAPIFVRVAFNEVIPMSNVWANALPLTRMTVGGLPFWQGTIPADTRPGPQTVYFLGKDQLGGLATFIAPYQVQAPNQRPTVSDIPNQVIQQNNSTGPIPFTIGDAETPSSSLTLSNSSSNPTLVTSTNVVFGGSGSNRTVTVTPATNQTGTATITVTVTDANGGSASDTFFVTVQPIGVKEVFSPTGNPTPPNFAYATLPASVVVFPNGFVLRNISHGRLHFHPAPPLLTSNQTYSSDSDVRFEFSVNGGATFSNAVAPSDVTVRLTTIADDGSDRTFNTEMISLNVAGGTLPPGVRIRESPTLVSPGRATSRTVSTGGAMLSSFFDVSIDLSINNGATWMAGNVPARVVLASEAAEAFSFSGNLTPPSAVYASVPGVVYTNQSGLRIRNVTHGRLRLHATPPPLGSNQTYTSDGEVRLEYAAAGSSFFSNALAPANVVVRLGQVKDDGLSKFFDTEMLSLDIAGGTLPPAVRIRESPTRQSLGRATIREVRGGSAMISSFFNVELDVSQNNGATFMPNLLPVRVELALEAPENLSLSGNMTPPNFSYNTPLNPPLVTNNAGIIIRRVRHGRLALHPQPPPVVDFSYTYGSPSTAQIEFSTNGGQTFREATATGNVAVVVMPRQNNGTTLFFDTEMIALDLGGGSLPPGLRLRESPTRRSLGRATLRGATNGPTLVSSFFDVEIEVTTDSGANWMPSLSPVRVELTSQAPENLEPSDNLTPANSGYVSAINAPSINYGAGVFTRNYIYFEVQPHPPVPPLGSNVVYSSTDLGRFQISLDGERTYADVQANGQISERLIHATDIGPTKFFDTEMLQLDLFGGNLPPNVRLRVNPVKRSLGQAAIRALAPDLGFHVDSFFDLWMQLSLDNGATWNDARNEHHVVLVAPFLKIDKQGSNAIVSWAPPEFPQILQSATTVTGTWINLPSATNPYFTTATNRHQFYRTTVGP